MIVKFILWIAEACISAAFKAKVEIWLKQWFISKAEPKVEEEIKSVFTKKDSTK